MRKLISPYFSNFPQNFRACGAFFEPIGPLVGEKIEVYSAKQVDFSPPQAEKFWGFTVHKNEKTIDFSPPQAKKMREIS